jgi:hypothetical protein
MLIAPFLACNYLKAVSGEADCLQSQNGGNYPMAKLEEYRQIVQELLKTYTDHTFSNPDLEAELIYDLERDRYQVVYVG